MTHTIWTFGKNYPIPLFAIIGLLAGAVSKFGFGLSHISHWIWYATLSIGSLPIIYNTVKEMLKGRFALDIIAMLAIIAAIFMDEAFAGAVVVLMQSGGEAIENFGLRRASSSLEALIARAPHFAYRKIDSRIEKIHIEEICVGDHLIVRSGDLVPTDGTILEGTCEIDESALTGEPLAHSKTVGDPVYSGSIDVNGSFEMRADRLSQESQYAKIISLVQKAQQEKAPIERLANRYAIVFTPLTVAMAALGFLYTGDAATMLAVLVVATPCPLILATPLAVLSAMNQASELGIIFKGGTPMEQVGEARAMVFDKTGTITFGTPKIEKIVPLEKEKAKDILYKAAVLEQLSSHSLAKMIVAAGTETYQTLPLPTHFEEVPGKGIKGEVEGKQYVVGSFLFLKEEMGSGCFDECQEAIDRFTGEGKQLAFIGSRGRCIGYFVFSDHIRPGIRSMVEGLYALGVKQVVMLTGDIRKTAETIARQAGIQIVEPELLPEQKVHIIKKLEIGFTPVVMVGDGINDAPALAAATVGIAMGAYGSAISAETADIVLLVDDPTRVENAMRISRKMLHIAKQGIFVGMGLSFSLMLFAAAGIIPPAIGALCQEVVDVAVIFNALRARKA